MKCVLFLSVCLVLVISGLQQAAGYDHQKHRKHDLTRYLYPEPVKQDRKPNSFQSFEEDFNKDRFKRDTYKYDFESYNDIHPPNERQHKPPKYDEEKERVMSRDASHKCLDYCRKCGSSFGNTYVCAEDVGYHKPPFTFMLFSNKCQMKCYNKCHNTNYRYSTNALCQKVMAVLENDDSSTKHPIRHERHHIWVNSQKTFDGKHKQ